MCKNIYLLVTNQYDPFKFTPSSCLIFKYFHFGETLVKIIILKQEIILKIDNSMFKRSPLNSPIILIDIELRLRE